MKDYQISYIPTASAPADSRRFDAGHPHATLAEAKEEARNYLATYPERMQFAQIVASEIVWSSPCPYCTDPDHITIHAHKS